MDSSDYMFVRIIERSAPSINPNVNYELWRLVVTGGIALVQNVDIYKLFTFEVASMWQLCLLYSIFLET